MTVEHRRGRVVDDAFELFVAGAMRHIVVHLQEVFHMLGLVDEIQAMHLRIGTFSIQVDMIGVAHIAAVEGDDHDLQSAVGQLLDLKLPLDGGLIAYILQHIQLKA